MSSNAFPSARTPRPPTACLRRTCLALGLIFTFGTATRIDAQIATSTWIGNQTTATGNEPGQPREWRHYWTGRSPSPASRRALRAPTREGPMQTAVPHDGSWLGVRPPRPAPAHPCGCTHSRASSRMRMTCRGRRPASVRCQRWHARAIRTLRATPHVAVVCKDRNALAADGFASRAHRAIRWPVIGRPCPGISRNSGVYCARHT